MIEKYILFTNLDWVTIGSVRTFTHALLLCNNEWLPGQRRCQVRGFGTDPSWPTFDIFVDAIEYTMEDAEGNLFKLKDDGTTEATITGAVLKLKEGPELHLVAQNRGHSIDIQTFEGERIIMDVWKVLEKKVPEYWNGPNMPTLNWRLAEDVRRERGS